MSAQTETQETEAQSDGPLLDLTDAGVKKFIKQAKARGYVTMDELNKVLPSEEVTSEAIEDTLAMLSEMGVNVVEAEEDAEGVETAQQRDLLKAAGCDFGQGFLFARPAMGLLPVPKPCAERPARAAISSVAFCSRRFCASCNSAWRLSISWVTAATLRSRSINCSRQRSM